MHIALTENLFVTPVVTMTKVLTISGLLVHSMAWCLVGALPILLPITYPVASQDAVGSSALSFVYVNMSSLEAVLLILL